jgi:glycosyltransferase involved in cell wall biosynthesis
MTLSVIIIVKNEAHDIGNCLGSVAGWADELVVLDSGSTDGTQALCREFGARVVETGWPGFGPQKQRALQLARSEWVLSIDADERVSAELRDEILAELAQPRASAYALPRLSSYCGAWIRHSGWAPDYVTRLFRRDIGRFSDDLVHEKVLIAHGNPVRQLTGQLLHYSFRDLDEVQQKVNDYSTLGAERARLRGRRGGVLKALVHGWWAFFRCYVIQRGFLDGTMGMALAISNAQGTFYRYLKMAYPKPARNGR